MHRSIIFLSKQICRCLAKNVPLSTVLTSFPFLKKMKNSYKKSSSFWKTNPEKYCKEMLPFSTECWPVFLPAKKSREILQRNPKKTCKEILLFSTECWAAAAPRIRSRLAGHPHTATANMNILFNISTQKWLSKDQPKCMITNIYCYPCQ